MEEIDILLTEIQSALSEYKKAVEYEEETGEHGGLPSKTIILRIANRIEYFLTTRDDKYFETIDEDVLDQFLNGVCDVLSNISYSCITTGDLDFINESLIFAANFAYSYSKKIKGDIDETLSARFLFNAFKIMVAEWTVYASRGDSLYANKKLEALLSMLNDVINPDLLYTSDPEALIEYYYYYIMLNYTRLITHYDNNEYMNSHLICLRLFKIMDRIESEYNITENDFFKEGVRFAMKGCSDCLIGIAKIANDTFTILGNDKSRVQEYIEKASKFLDEKGRKVLYSGQYLN